jgi:hypothetical protein
MIVCTVGFFGGAIVLSALFDMVKINADGAYILVVFAGLTYPVITFFRKAVNFVVERIARITSRREKKKKGRHTRSARRIKL